MCVGHIGMAYVNNHGLCYTEQIGTFSFVKLYQNRKRCAEVYEDM